MQTLSQYDYDLPPERIAQVPLEQRDQSKMLHLNKSTGEIEHKNFQNIIDILQPNDLLILNNSRVSALRIFGKKTTGANVEALLLTPTGKPNEFTALMKPGKRLQPGTTVHFEKELNATVTQNLENGQKNLQFQSVENLDKILQEIGKTPLPPYIKVALENSSRYQNIYADTNGSAATPTAGLHFTEKVFEKIKNKKVAIEYVTLDVSIDTFKPVQVDDLSKVTLHGERCTIPAKTASAIENCKGRIIAVGTTTVRTLESFATDKRKIEPGAKVTRKFIYPGYEFKIIDGMLTNFHMPKTTMLMMISALSTKDHVFRAYQEAIKEDYRFLSFGDSMLIL